MDSGSGIFQSIEASDMILIPDIETALSNTKKMFSDPLFAKYSAKVDKIRKLVNTTMMVRLADF